MWKKKITYNVIYENNTSVIKFCGKNCLRLTIQTLPHTLSAKNTFRVSKIFVEKYTRLIPLMNIESEGEAIVTCVVMMVVESL